MTAIQRLAAIISNMPTQTITNMVSPAFNKRFSTSMGLRLAPAVR